MTAPIVKAKPVGERLTIDELIDAYDQHAREYYGERSEQIYGINAAVMTLSAMYGAEAVDLFSPLKMQRVLEQRAEQGDCRKPVKNKRFKPLSRSYINDILKVLKRMFKWGVSQELVPNEVFQSLATVEGARKGRGKLAQQTHEPTKVLPVLLSELHVVFGNRPSV